MRGVIGATLKRKNLVAGVFLLLTVLSVFLTDLVEVNYNIMDYLPDEAPSTMALDVMQEEYDQGIPNVRAMVPGLDIPGALALKAQIAAIEGVDEITWLDDVADVTVPLETMDQDMVESYYKDGYALFSITVDDALAKTAMYEIREAVGPDTAMSGIRVNTTFASETVTDDIRKIMIIAVPIILVILLLTTTSWFEPILFLLTIMVAILINMGTNIMFGEISFITQGVAAILQLAVSMDYAIFILHRFSELREEGLDIGDAMVEAIVKSFSSVTASGVTTIVGFASLILMRIKIGPDVGWVMTKGIIISLICVFLFLPAFTLICYKLIDKTRHKSLMPGMKKFGKVVARFSVPMLILFSISVVPCYLAIEGNDFVYFDIFSDERTAIGQDAMKINDTFGEQSSLVLLVERGNFAKENALVAEIEEIECVTSVLSYVSTVGAEVPIEYVPQDARDKLLSANYSRMVVSLDAYMESTEAFAAVETIRALGGSYYPDAFHLAGEACNTYDMKNIVEEDNARVNMIAVAAVFVILLLTFRSISIPFVLILAIEGAIWINCGIPYFSGDPLFYIGYLVIGSLQLGATVDYAILFTNRYFEYRRELYKQEALEKTVETASISIFTSGSILFIAGTALARISSNALLSQLGMLVARGALLSLGSVLFVLPAMLLLLDGVIQKTSHKLKFKMKEKGKKNENIEA